MCNFRSEFWTLGEGRCNVGFVGFQRIGGSGSVGYVNVGMWALTWRSKAPDCAGLLSAGRLSLLIISWSGNLCEAALSTLPIGTVVLLNIERIRVRFKYRAKARWTCTLEVRPPQSPGEGLFQWPQAQTSNSSPTLEAVFNACCLHNKFMVVLGIQDWLAAGFCTCCRPCQGCENEFKAVSPLENMLAGCGGLRTCLEKQSA